MIHHSATRQGSARHFERYHKKRGMKNGLAYHFVINNGTSGREDGELEIGSRWKKQLDGGHCKQRWVNHHGIGICLVGNFSKQKVTKKQFKTLYKLCQLLMDQYQIPVANVIGHGQMRGEHSKCPGKNFPMSELKKILIRYQKIQKNFVP
ncbi:peptidoglycan recognition family protein [Candidatus Auribacterota bacterium]